MTERVETEREHRREIAANPTRAIPATLGVCAYQPELSSPPKSFASKHTAQHSKFTVSGSSAHVPSFYAIFATRKSQIGTRVEGRRDCRESCPDQPNWAVDSKALVTLPLLMRRCTNLKTTVGIFWAHDEYTDGLDLLIVATHSLDTRPASSQAQPRSGSKASVVKLEVCQLRCGLLWCLWGNHDEADTAVRFPMMQPQTKLNLPGVRSSKFDTHYGLDWTLTC
ncbi:uncharacterized protein MEPE_05228 [Melanopsichium pennsylvanicum]|uniref:Uncharacterized protein n=1 Tax=Melanopsichium pennsylvanicum TaxID=63383 RepID=A0AAJ5C7G7_9BASI|nr:uncharacterized protein MEPE_05228 [Melanopsichium pennsylvanicum]